ncbi:MAG: MmgE/PrpD family protein [Hyphomonas sp.]|nr:MmgE/PrpD family protein [Hyphomonas sp.]MCC0017593.1 MmgE/PrpD family protein [Rhodobiaceae bacterium]
MTDNALIDKAPVSVPGLTERVANFATNRAAQIPVNALEMGRLSIFDWLTVLRAGSNEPVACVIRSLVSHEMSEGASSAFGMESKVSARAAALINGSISHALDYDDTHFGFGGHPTVAVLPAVLALAEEKKLGGRELLEGFVVGAEAACRLGVFLGRQHYAAGFHPTATAGTFGATVGASRLLGLSANQARHALGFASTRASGLRSQFGTMGKPIHAGMSSSNGVEAGLLALFGLVSRADGIECVEGFAGTHASGNQEDCSEFGPETPFIFQDVQYKFYACCHGIHGPLEAVLSLRESVKENLEEIARIRFSVNPQWKNICCINGPKTGLEIKFSLSTVIAMALIGIDTSSPESFADELCVDTRIATLADKTVIEFHPSVDDATTLVSVEMVSGTRMDASFDLRRPVSREFTAEKLQRKAVSLVGESHAEQLWKFVSEIEMLSFEELSAAIRQEFAPPLGVSR